MKGFDMETRLENQIWNEIQSQIGQAVKYEIETNSWLEQHCPGRWHKATDGQIQFDDERDQVMFLLRWGHDKV